MRTFSKFATVVSIAVLGTSFSVSSIAADVFKWVDANGVTHYSDSVPDDQKAEKMAPGLSRMTVVPMPKFVAPPSRTPSVAQRSIESPTPASITVIEYSDASAQAQLDEWRAQCIAERWVDCDDRRALYARYGTMADWGKGLQGARIIQGPTHRR